MAFDASITDPPPIATTNFMPLFLYYSKQASIVSKEGFGSIFSKVKNSMLSYFSISVTS